MLQERPQERPPFRADHVGSLLRPPELLAARERFRRGEIPRDELILIEDRAVADVIRLQEDIGLKAVTDGEFRRTLWHMDFLTKLDNIEATRSPMKVAFRSADGTIERSPSATKVVGKVGRSQPIFVDHFRFVQDRAKALAKLTIPSPSILHFRGGRRAVDEIVYPDMQAFYDDVVAAYRREVQDLADTGCRYLQIDDVNFAYMCDPKMLRDAAAVTDVNTLARLYARLINRCIEAKPDDMVVSLHLCRGNFEGAWVAEGGYDSVAEILFNEVDATIYFLEYDTARAGGFEPLRLLPQGKTVVLGLISSKIGALECADDIKRRIDEAAKFCPLEQLALSPQCGFASGERGNKLTIDEERKKLELCVEIARDVWGTV